MVDKHGNKDVSYHYIPLSALAMITEIVIVIAIKMKIIKQKTINFLGYVQMVLGYALDIMS